MLDFLFQVLVLFVGYMFTYEIAYRKGRRDVINILKNEMKNLESTSCPHGFEDWDDCPDCCH